MQIIIFKTNSDKVMKISDPAKKKFKILNDLRDRMILNKL